MLYTASSSCFLTSMAKWTLCFLLLLPLMVCFDNEVTLVKTIGSKPDVTPVCKNETVNITLIVCKIRTERNRSEECRLLYHYGWGFEHGCDSRFTLMTKNQTVFLHLTSLTPVDSGNFTCECSYPGGTDILHLSVTVEDDEDANSSRKMQIPGAATGVTIVIVITGVITGLIHWTKSNGGRSRSATSGLSARETPGSVDPDDPEEPYTSLQQPASDLYQTISNLAGNRVAVRLENKEIDGGETDPSCKMHENIQTKESR